MTGCSQSSAHLLAETLLISLRAPELQKPVAEQLDVCARAGSCGQMSEKEEVDGCADWYAEAIADAFKIKREIFHILKTVYRGLFSTKQLVVKLDLHIYVSQNSVSISHCTLISIDIKPSLNEL